MCSSDLICRGLPGDPDGQDPFAALERLARGGGSWLGWLAYEAGAWLEPAEHWRRPDLACLVALRFDPLLHFDRLSRRLWLEGEDQDRLEGLAALVRQLTDAARAHGSPEGGSGDGAGDGSGGGDPSAADGDPGIGSSGPSESGPRGGATGVGGRRDAGVEGHADAAGMPHSAGAALELAPPIPPELAPPIPLEAWHWHTTAETYAAQVRQLLERIAEIGRAHV